MKQKELAVWMKVICVVGAVCVLFLALAVAPAVGRDLARAYPEYERFLIPCLAFLWLTALPVLAVAVCAWLIASDIGRDNSFSYENAARLRLCCILAVTDTGLYLAGGAVLFALDMLHPAILLRGAFICAVGAACAVVFAALSHLTLKAAELKGEQDLTI